MLAQLQLIHHQGMEQTDEVGTGGYLDAAPELFERASAADALARLQHQHTLAGAGEVSRACQAVVAGADDDVVPWSRGQLVQRHRQADLAEHGVGGRHRGITQGQRVPPSRAAACRLTGACSTYGTSS